MKAKKLIPIYFLLLALEMLGDFFFAIKGLPYGIWIFKPLLMPILAFWYYQETKAATTLNKIILAALFFSWWGDNFLMPAIFKTDINFLLGLGSFLVAHLFYVAAFIKTNIEKPPLLKSKPYLALPFILFGAALIRILFQENVPGFSEMSIPVVVYASVIMIMVITALNRKGRVNDVSFKTAFIGALMFMFSDTFIALSEFTTFIESGSILSRLLIMPLYVFGQYFIVKGCFLQEVDLQNKKGVEFRGKKFPDHLSYFQHMVDELGFPDIVHLFESKTLPSGDLNLNIDLYTVSKEAPTVVFVPGTSVYGLCYAELLYEIAKKGYNIVAMDPRGHGRSEGSRGDYTIGELMMDVENVVAFSKDYFNEKVSLMGSSQGGIVSFYLAARDIKVDSIICQNFADLAWEETHTIARYPKLAKMGQPIIKVLGSLLPNVKVSTLSYLDLKSIKIKYFGNLHRFIVDDPYAITKISLRAAKSLVGARMAKSVEEIKIPIFVFQGTKDIVFPVKYTQKLYDRLTCPKQMKLYLDCDHALMVENVDLIKNDIIVWLDQVYSRN